LRTRYLFYDMIRWQDGSIWIKIFLQKACKSIRKIACFFYAFFEINKFKNHWYLAL
jgi:hypothetical protein